MKNSILRTGVALACAVSLASCGGGNTGTLVLGGSASGVTLSGLVIQNNNGADLTIAPTTTGETTFVFKDYVPTDSVYNVTVKSKPSNVVDCSVVNGKGNTGLYSVYTVKVVCVITTKTLTGKVTGLDGQTGLILANGADQVRVTANGDFAMAPVSLGYPYGVTVLQQPVGANCTVANGVGTVTDNVANVAVTCVKTA